MSSNGLPPVQKPSKCAPQANKGCSSAAEPAEELKDSDAKKRKAEIFAKGARLRVKYERKLERTLQSLQSLRESQMTDRLIKTEQGIRSIVAAELRYIEQAERVRQASGDGRAEQRMINERAGVEGNRYEYTRASVRSTSAQVPTTPTAYHPRWNPPSAPRKPKRR